MSRHEDYSFAVAAILQELGIIFTVFRSNYGYLRDIAFIGASISTAIGLELRHGILRFHVKRLMRGELEYVHVIVVAKWTMDDTVMYEISSTVSSANILDESSEVMTSLVLRLFLLHCRYFPD